MQADRWKKIQELYEAAIALPAEKRAEVLEQACPGGAAIADRIRPEALFFCLAGFGMDTRQSGS